MNTIDTMNMMSVDTNELELVEGGGVFDFITDFIDGFMEGLHVATSGG